MRVLRTYLLIKLMLKRTKMKFLISTLLCCVVYTSHAQSETLLYYDHGENHSWPNSGWWWNTGYSNYYTNTSVSAPASAVLFGYSGSSYEYNYYDLPAVNVDPSRDHVFRMRLAAQRFTSTSNTRGLDVGDYITVRLSQDGNSYSSELRVKGRNNAYWDYSSTAVASKVADGSLTEFQPSGGGNRTNTGDGYSYIELVIPAGASSIAIDIFVRANRAGEEWWMDNFELYELSPVELPVELLSFEAECAENEAIDLSWATASEYNSSHFTLESSRDGENWVHIKNVAAAGNTSQRTDYLETIENGGANYYRLSQYDKNGALEIFPEIYTNCEETKTTFELYPNPSNGKFTLNFNESVENTVLVIRNSLGKTVLNQEINDTKTHNVSIDLPTGVYFVTTTNNNSLETHMKRMIIR